MITLGDLDIVAGNCLIRDAGGVHDPALRHYCPILHMRIYQSCSSDHTLYHHYHTSCHHHGLTPGGGRSCSRHREKHQGRQGEVAASQGMDQSVLSAFHHGPICLELLTITFFRFEDVCPLQVKHHSVFTFFTPRRCTPVPFDI